jgi:hypothetical protein
VKERFDTYSLTLVMKNKAKLLFYIIIILIGYFAILNLKRLLTVDDNSFPNRLSDISLDIIIKLISLLYLGLISWLFKLNRLLKHYFTSYHNLHLLKPISATILIILLFRFIEYMGESTPLISIVQSAIFNLLVGLNEEILFKGLIFSFIVLYFKRQKSYLIKSIVVTSLIFALVHLTNLISEPDNLDGITGQVISAFVVSMYLFGLFAGTKNLLLVSFFHGLLNIAFGGFRHGFEPEDATEVVTNSDSSGYLPSIYWFTLLSLVLFFGIRMFIKYHDSFDEFLGGELDKPEYNYSGNKKSKG